jgi:hypothetical protein
MSWRRGLRSAIGLMTVTTNHAGMNRSISVFRASNLMQHDGCFLQVAAAVRRSLWRDFAMARYSVGLISRLARKFICLNRAGA